MKKLINLIILIVVTLGVVLVYCFNETRRLSSYFKGSTLSSTIEQVSIQEKVNNRLDKVRKSKKYTIENAYVELNPYGISPLSAIIIFQTKEKNSIDVYINDEYFTKMEKSQEHVIPIYGLYDDFNNKVTLKMDGYEYTYYIKCEKANVEYPLNVEKNEVINDKNGIIFTVASYKTYFTGWDKDGKLRFYLTVDNRMDVEWLPNGHFLIGTSEGQVRENFVGLVEMDYLGKIYNYYNLEHGYGFEMQILKNGNYMLAGGDKAIYFNHQYIYEMNPSDGKVIDGLDIYEVIKEIDSDFPEEYLGPKAIRNGFYYDEENGNLVVSFREINTVFNFDYKNKKLNYVFTGADSLFSSDVWKKYLVKVKSGRYPLGQHTPTITKDGYLALFNNGYDRYGVAFENKSNKVGDYNSAYTAMEIYDIKNNVANLVWKSDFDKKYFSIKYGIFNVLENNHKFMDCGYILKDDFREKSDNSLVEVEKNVDDIYSLIIELDENDKVVFKATTEEGKYRAFKHNLYDEETKNVDLEQFNIIDTVEKSDVDVLSVGKIDVDSSMEWINTFEFTKHTFSTNYKINENDEVKFYFLNRRGKVYSFVYKNKDDKNINKVFNIDIPSDRYRVFVSINDELYDTKKVYSF